MNCLKCKEPGHCCKEFYLTDPEDGETWLIKKGKKKIIEKLREYDLPFVPVKKGLRNWIFGCTQLNKNGRCKIYSSRPDLCRRYKAGTGYLCVHSKEYKEGLKLM